MFLLLWSSGVFFYSSSRGSCGGQCVRGGGFQGFFTSDGLQTLPPAGRGFLRFSRLWTLLLCLKPSVYLALGLLDSRQGDSWGCLSPCLLNIIRNYRQNVCELFPDAGNLMSIAAEPDCLPTFSQGFADLIKTTWGDNLRLDLIISNIITTGKPTVVEP